MKVFCPNCGSPNEAAPGARVTCFACSASFDAPGASAVVPPPAQPAVADSRPASQAFGGGYAPASAPAPVATAETNPLAIASIPVSLLCCAPVGIGLGAMALSQINQTGQKGKELAWAGIIIGAGMLMLTMCSVVFSVLAEMAK
jgi:hypothetical protein